MKYILTSLLFSLFLIQNISALTIDEITGCYRTLTMNGNEVKVGPRPEYSQTQFYIAHNNYFLNVETKRPMTSVVLSFYTGADGAGYHHFSNAIAFLDNGEWNDYSDQLDYFFDYDVYFQKSFRDIQKIDHKVELSLLKLSDGTFKGSIDYMSFARNIGDVFTFTLKKEACVEKD
jgi:hypothetical protein